jgi:hypothetical protein
MPMKRTAKKTTLGLDVDLSVGILIAECETGQYEVVGPVSTINEGIEIARHDHTRRLRTVEQGDDPMHVDIYKVWARNHDGDYAIVFETRPGDAVL